METENTELLKTQDARKIIESLLFITDRPLTAKKLAETVEITEVEAAEIVAELQKEFYDTGRAIQIIEAGGGFQMSTKPEYGRWVRALYNESGTTKLSNAALETLAIIAYKQPITRTEIESIRGVDISGPLEKLLERALVRAVGKKETIGRPMMYGTTEDFLRLFGLNRLSELPDIEIFAAKAVPETQADLPFDAAAPAETQETAAAEPEVQTEEQKEPTDEESI